jgi:hypothetical protein
MSAARARGDDRNMPCVLKLVLDIPKAVIDVVLGPEEKIAYVSVTTR